MPRLLLIVVVCLCTGSAVAQISTPRASAVEPPALPSDRSIWSMDEVTQAAAALHRIAQYEPAKLPHYTIGSRSAFSRLTAPTVLADTAGLAPVEQVRYAQRAVQTYEQVLLIYADVQRTLGGYDVEIAELSRVLMRASAQLAIGVAALPPPQENVEAFAQGAARVQAGLAEMMRGVVAMASDAAVLSEVARERLLLYAAAEGQTIAPLLMPTQRTALARDIAAALEQPAASDVTDGLRALQEVFTPR